MTMLLSLLWVLQVSSADTLEIRSIERPPLPGEAIDSAHGGGTGGGSHHDPDWRLGPVDTFR
jgi:hypothetical protein